MNGWKRMVWAGSLGCSLALSGCGGFFVDPGAGNGLGGGGGGGSTPTVTGNYVYAVNQGNTLSGFSVATSALTSLFTPIALPSPLSSASSVAITRDNSLVFVGGLGGIVPYNVATNGGLTAVSNGATVEVANFVSMATSPDGKWLLALDGENNVVYVFSISYTTRSAVIQNQYTINIGGVQVLGATAAARSLAISPDGTAVAVAVGTAGDELFSFTTATGVLAGTNAVAAPGGSYSDDSVVFDGTYSASAGTATASTHLFIGRGQTGTGSSQILAFPLTGTTLGATPVTSASGQNPYQMLVDSTAAYLYAANRSNGTTGTSTVSAYTLGSTGALTQLANSPFSSGSLATALAEDNARTHLIAASAGGNPDLTLYSFSTVTGNGGQFAPAGNSNNGTSTAGVVALAATH